MEQNNENILSEETIGFIKKCYIHLNQSRQGVWAFADLAEIVWNPKIQKKNKELYFSIIHDAIAYEIIKYEEILEISQLKNDFLAFYSKFVSKINTSHEYTNFLEDRITTLENRFGLVWKDQEEQLLKIVSEDEIILGVGKFLINRDYEFVNESKDKKKKFIKNKDGKQFTLTRKRGDSFLYFCKELNQLFLLYSVQSKINVYYFVENHYTKYYPILVKKGDNFGFGEVRDNLLMEGDNYFALQLLQFTHRGKIDVIYIDPPYNTGKGDFKYNDAYIGSDDGSRHSKWLSFMKKRLELCFQLMKENSVIFLSIDENEQARLKILCDSIFGEKNLIRNLPWDKGNSQNDADSIQENHEYILVYKKGNIELSNLNINEKPVILKNNKYYYKKSGGIVTGGKGGTLNKRVNLGYSIYYNKTTEELITKSDYDKERALTSNDLNDVYLKPDQSLIDNGFICIRPPQKKGLLGCWTWSESKFNKDKELIQISDSGAVNVLQEVDKSQLIEKNGKFYVKAESELPLRSIIKVSSGLGTKSLIKLFNKNVFDNSKPPELIKQLIASTNNPEAIVLDFFAGSGTTGQAVLELNLEDEGNRKFIICTNNENNICEDITYSRLDRINDPFKFNLDIVNINYGLNYLQIKHISDLDLESADDVGNFEYVKHINNVKFSATKTIKENDYLYITDTYSVFKKSNKNKKKEYCEFFEQSIRENITNLVFVSSDRSEYDYFRKVTSDYISTLKESPLFEKIRYYQMSKNYMDNMLSIINGEEEIDIEKYMNDEENQENGEQ